MAHSLKISNHLGHKLFECELEQLIVFLINHGFFNADEKDLLDVAINSESSFSSHRVNISNYSLMLKR